MAVSKEQIVYNCPKCNSILEFDIASQHMLCPNCNYVLEKLPNQKSTIREYDFTEIELSKADVEWGEQIHTVKCSSCGAELSIAKNDTTASCAFCGSSNILEVKQDAGIRPEGIIPFKVTKERSAEIFKNWIGRRWLAPNILKKMYQEDLLKPIYLPYWTYDADTNSRYAAMGGEVYYVTVSDGRGNRRQEQRVRWYNVSGSVSRSFDDVLVNGGGKNASLVTQVDEFNTGHLVPFSSAYLSGFYAEKYAMLPQPGFEMAQHEMYNYLVRDVESQVLAQYDVVQGISLDTTYSNVRFKHVLFPVWSSGFMFKNKIYSYVINGENGEIAGRYPYSPVKIAILTVLGLVLLFIIIYFLTGTEAGQEFLNSL